MAMKTTTARELLDRAHEERNKLRAEIKRRREVHGDHAGADYLQQFQLPKWDEQIARLERLAAAELGVAPAVQPTPQQTQPRGATRLEPRDIRRAAPVSPRTAPPRITSRYASAYINSGIPVSVPENLQDELHMVDANWHRAGHPQQGALFEHMQRLIRACQTVSK